MGHMTSSTAIVICPLVAGPSGVVEVAIGGHQDCDGRVGVRVNADVLFVAAAKAVMGLQMDRCLAIGRLVEAPVW